MEEIEKIKIFSKIQDIDTFQGCVKVFDKQVMKKEIVEKYIKKMPEDFNLPNVMLTTFFVYYKEKVKFVDISFKPRQGGVNSINLKKIIKIGWKAVEDFRKIKKEMDK